MFSVKVANRISCFCLIFFLQGIGVALATLATQLATPLKGARKGRKEHVELNYENSP